MPNYNLRTSEDIYKAVLNGIKKESTAVLTPENFNRLINDEALLIWLRDKVTDNDYDQPHVDLLRNLHKEQEYTIQDDTQGLALPKDYYRLQSLSLKTQIEDKVSSWMPGKRVSLDVISTLYANPFRTPSPSRLYYYQETDKIRLVSLPPKYKGRIAAARVIYISYPRPIYFNSSGNNSHGNLTKEQNKEVVDIAVRVFIERVKEERYQTVLMEESLKRK